MSRNILLLMGLPGAGKGTNGKFLHSKLLLPHVSTGEIFRSIIRSDRSSDAAVKLFSCIKNGELVPDAVVNNTVKEYLLSFECEKGVILDGYPRNINQAEFLSSYISGDKLIVIFFYLPEEVALQRLLGRVVCSGCNEAYNKYKDSKVEVCRICGSKEFESRSDDDENVIKSRFNDYKIQTEPLLSYYKDKNVLIGVDSSRSQEEIQADLQKIVENI